MRSLAVLMIAGFLAAGAVARAEPSSRAPMAVKIDQLRRDFQSPPPGYGPVPFWFWNGDLRSEELRRQVREMKEKGVSGAFMHARHGQITPYLSEDWFRMIKDVVDESAKTGFQAWLYDEDNWPSGTAGGRVTEGHPELRARYLKGFMTLKEKDSGQISIPRVEGKLISAVAYPEPPEDTPLDADLGRDLTGDISGSWIPGTQALSLPKLSLDKAWRVFLFWEMTDGYVDVMNPEATKRFLEITHEAYAKAVGSRFGTTVPGIFADESGLISIWDVSDPEAMPWSPLLAEEFRKRRGYDLLPKLPALLADIGPETTRFRQDYWQTISELYSEAFARPIGQWCAEHKIAFTGHVLSEELLRPQVKIQGNPVLFYREMQIPGVDNLRVTTGGLHHKLASSVAHQQGKERVLSETFGACGWGTPLSARKASVDWQLTQGINLFCPHASYYTIFGKRKRENPPSEFVQEPYWPYYKGFSDYIARLSWMLTRGKPATQVAVLYPIRSAWAHYHPRNEDPLESLIEKDLHYICNMLLELHYDFDFISEDSLLDAQIRDGKLHVGECEYRLLVMPSVTTLTRPAWMKAIGFFEQGGKVLNLGLLPRESERGYDDVLGMASAREGMMDLEAVYRNYLFTGVLEGINAPTFPAARSNAAGGRISSFQPRLVMEQAEAKSRVRRLLRESLISDAETMAPEIRYHHRHLEDGEIYFFVNTSDKPVEAHIRVPIEGAPELWDPETGRIEPMVHYSVLEGEGIVLPFGFGPHESRLVVISGPVRPHIDAANFEATGLEIAGRKVAVTGWTGRAGRVSAVIDDGDQRYSVLGEGREAPPAIQLSGPWQINRLQPNTLVLSDWRFTRGDYSPGKAGEPVWEPLPARQGIPWHPDLEPLEIERPDFVTYLAGFQVQEMPSRVSLVLEPIQAPVRVFINKREVSPTRTGILDPEFLEADITPYVQQGINQVLLVADYRNAVAPQPTNLHRITCDLVPEPARLSGDFALRAEGESFALVAEPGSLLEGSWTDQGYPHYSGTMEYRCELEIPHEMADCRLVLEMHPPANLAVLEINGKPVGTKLWGPFTFDITDQAVIGRNTISLKIANTAINALLGKPQPSGLLGPVTLRAFPFVRLTERGSVNWGEFLPTDDDGKE